MAGFIREKLAGWFNPDLEKRLEAARKDKLADRIKLWYGESNFTFMCNLCREDIKGTRPAGYTESTNGYNVLHFCQTCLQKIDKLW